MWEISIFTVLEEYSGKSSEDSHDKIQPVFNVKLQLFSKSLKSVTLNQTLTLASLKIIKWNIQSSSSY